MNQIRARFTSPNLYGAMLIIVTGILYAISNSLVHSLSTTFSAAQILFFKSSIPLMIMAILLRKNLKTHFKTSIFNLHLYRSGFGALGNWFWIFALQTLSLATASAISMSSAIFTALGAVILFSEKANWQRWLCIFTGFFGVLIIYNPSTNIFTIYSLLPLLSALMFSCSTLFMKKISQHDSTQTTLLYLMLFMALFSAPSTCIGWVTPTLQDFGILIAIGSLYFILQLFLFEAYKHGEVSFVAPFKYARFPTNILAGFLLFSEVPTYATLIGGTFIAITAIQLVFHDKRKRLQQS